MVGPQGCPALAQVTVVHWCVAKLQSSPLVHSAALTQGAPTAPVAWHVDDPFTEGQTSGVAHSRSDWHGAPALPGGWHCPVPVHSRPGLHCTSALLQAPPAPT